MKSVTILILFLLLSTSLFAQRGERNRGRGPGGFPGFGGPVGERIDPEDLEFEMGVATIPDRETFEKLSYQGEEVMRDSYLAGLEFVKFIIDKADSDEPEVYFMNTENYRAHPPYMSMVGLDRRGGVRGALTYLPRLKAPDGTAGLYIFDFQPRDSYSYDEIKSYRDILTSKMPILKGKFAFHPLEGNLDLYEEEKEKYEKGNVAVHLDDDLYANITFLPLNVADSYGLLKVMESDEARPSPREIVICKTLPNQMPRVAGVITEARQTPLSHVNLRAIQDRVPNAYIERALALDPIKSLVGKYVRYQVTPQGYKLSEVTKAEVDKHFDALRPAEPQAPKRDLSVTGILPLDEITFRQSASFGVKTSNLATLRTFEFPRGTVPDGFGVPFHFYDAFMKHNGFYERADQIIEDPELRDDRNALAEALKAFRKRIKAGDIPDWMAAALREVQRKFSGSSIRCRSSTNNEDLPGFSGAGLYDSYTHKRDEGHLGKSIKQVYASLWNFRAFEERAFYRIDHKSTAMGVLLHPNFKGEKANGVAVTDDILYESQGNYYLNIQVGEDLVTNPDEASSPEETLLGWYDRDGHEIVRHSKDAEDGKSLLSDEVLTQLRAHLARIHSRFAKLYGRDREDRKFAMEVEFKVTRDGKLSIKQARPWVF